MCGIALPMRQVGHEDIGNGRVRPALRHVEAYSRHASSVVVDSLPLSEPGTASRPASDEADTAPAGGSVTPKRRSFGTRVAGLTAVRLISVAAGFLTNVVAARLLGTSGVGAAGAAVALATVAAIIANGGINISTIFMLGQRPSDVRRILGALIPIAVGAAILAAALMAIAGLAIGPSIGLGGRPDLFLAAAALAAAIVTFEFIGAIVLGLGQTRTYVTAELVRGVGTLAATTVLLVGLLRSDVGFILAATIAIVAATAFNVRRIARSIGAIEPRIDGAVAGEALAIGMRGQIGNILQLMNLRLDQLIVPAFLSLSSAGVYVIAVRVSEALAQIGSAAASLIFPEVARQADPLETSLTERAVRATAVLVAVAGLVLGLLAEPFLTIAFGSEFAEGSLALRILLVAMLPLSLMRILAGDLKGRGRPGTVSVAMAVAALVTVGLDLILIPRFGIAGAATASLIAYAVSAAQLGASFVRVTGADARALVPGPSDARALLRFLRALGAGTAP
jgi:stage V sporulation protein B